MSAESRTEKPTPRKLAKARKEGQVARSVEVNSAFVLLTLAAAFAIAGPSVLARLEETMRVGLVRTANPDESLTGLGGLTVWALRSTASAVAPLALAAALAGLAASTLQVRPRFTPAAMKFRPQKLNPLPGFKRIFGKEGLIETGKASGKAAVVGGAAYLAIRPRLHDTLEIGRLGPAGLLHVVGGTIDGLLLRVGVAFAAIAVADYVWQKHRHVKSLKMTKEEVKQESKNADTPPEVRRAIRRRQMEQARKRMMAAVPDADVVVVNPTHYACALRYDGTAPAPELVAKGADLVAAAIRRIAEEHRVPIVSNPPLARALHRQVEVGHQIPEELYVAVAEVLAFVFRTAGRRRRRRALTA